MRAESTGGHGGGGGRKNQTSFILSPSTLANVVVAIANMIARGSFCCELLRKEHRMGFDPFADVARLVGRGISTVKKKIAEQLRCGATCNSQRGLLRHRCWEGNL